MMIEPILILLTVLGLNLLFYFKIPANYVIKLPLIVCIAGFSLILTPLFMSPIYDIPTTPYIQLLFMVIQTVIFFFSCLEYIKIKKEKRGIT